MMKYVALFSAFDVYQIVVCTNVTANNQEKRKARLQKILVH